MATRLKYNRIKTVLTDKGKTNQELADYLAMSVNTVTKWNTNKLQPTIPVLFLIAQFLEVDACELLEKVPKAVILPKRNTKTQ